MDGDWCVSYWFEQVLRVLGSYNLTKFNGSLDKICCNMCRIVALLFLWFAIMSFSLQKLHRSITWWNRVWVKTPRLCLHAEHLSWRYGDPLWGWEGFNHRAMVRNIWIFKTDLAIQNTVDGRNPWPVEVGSLSHDLQGFIHPSWLFGISEPSTAWPISCCCNVDKPWLFFDAQKCEEIGLWRYLAIWWNVKFLQTSQMIPKFLKYPHWSLFSGKVAGDQQERFSFISGCWQFLFSIFRSYPLLCFPFWQENLAFHIFQGVLGFFKISTYHPVLANRWGLNFKRLLNGIHLATLWESRCQNN